MTAASQRYSTIAAALHWLIAAAILGMIPAGWWMADAIKVKETAAQAYQVFQIHKSLGLTILFLSIARLGWRLLNPPPPLPAGMTWWEKFAARAVQGGFYAVMIIAPLSGWAYASTGWSAEMDRPLAVATTLWGIPMPHFPIAEAGVEARRAAAHAAMSVHSIMAWGAIALTALHVGGALKHHFINKDDVLASMVPGLKMRGAAHDPVKPGPWPFVAGAGALAALALVVFAVSKPDPLPPPPAIIETAPDVGAAAELPAVAPEAEPGAAPLSPVPAAAPAAAIPRWTVDAKASRIGFTGTHAGSKFDGRFERWSADIRFDPQNLAGSKAVVTIETGSARTGDGTQEASLAEGEWFDPKGFPTARWESTGFKSLGGDRYQATGRLTIKGKTTPANFPFTLAIKDGRASLKAGLTLDRIALDMGVVSDASAEWVSREIGVELRVEAKQAQ